MDHSAMGQLVLFVQARFEDPIVNSVNLGVRY